MASLNVDKIATLYLVLNQSPHIFKLMSSCNTGLWYAGRINDTLTEEIIAISKSETFESNNSASDRKLAFLMIESFQNIIRHGLNEDSNLPSRSTFGLTKTNGLYNIFSSNHILQANKQSISSSINNLNLLSMDELNEAYRKQLSSGFISAKGGAGLGLIELRRKSGNPLQYNLGERENDADFNLQVDYEPEADDAPHNSVESIDNNIVVKDYLHDEGIKLAFKGDFQTDLIAPVLTIFLRNLSSFTSDVSKAKTLYEAGTYILQNLINYAEENESYRKGIIFVKTDQSQVKIVTLNYLDPAHYDILSNEIGSSSDTASLKQRLIGSNLGVVNLDDYSLTVDSFKDGTDHIFSMEIIINLD
ncbi:MAG: hypothetical protein ACI9J3_004096 [Parvicellaceae bacterium]|jgi:hypothetical protein